MGSFDGAEICELVGLFLLNNLTQLIGSNNIGLYKDDGLAILENATGSTSERVKKWIKNLFQQHGLRITAETNLVQTNFLDVTFNLNTDPSTSHTTSLSTYTGYPITRQLSRSNFCKCLLLASRNSRVTTKNSLMQFWSTKRQCIKADTLESLSM